MPGIYVLVTHRGDTGPRGIPLSRKKTTFHTYEKFAVQRDSILSLPHVASTWGNISLSDITKMAAEKASVLLQQIKVHPPSSPFIARGASRAP